MKRTRLDYLPEKLEFEELPESIKKWIDVLFPEDAFKNFYNSKRISNFGRRTMRQAFSIRYDKDPDRLRKYVTETVEAVYAPFGFASISEGEEMASPEQVYQDIVAIQKKRILDE